jgi:ankyrin repeat protein
VTTASTARIAASVLGVVLASTAPVGAAGDHALVDAARRGDVAAVRAELQRGADVNAAAPDGTVALHWASYANHAAIAGELIRAGARVDAANRYGVRPLSLASAGGHAAIVRLLLEAGADPDAAPGVGETPLMSAARSGSVAAVAALLAHGAVVDAREPSREQTALMWAAAEGHADVVRALVRGGADVKARSKNGFTPLLFAAREGHRAAAAALLDSGSTLDESLAVSTAETAGGVARQQREASLDAFLLASGNAHFDLAADLLERGANVNAAPRGYTALHQISWVRKMGDVGGNDPPPQGSGIMTSLEFVRKLVAAGADVNARASSRRLPVGASRLNFTGATPFFLAARTADLELMRLLLELGANPRLTTNDGTTPLMVAAGVGSSLPGEEPGTEAEALEAVKMTLTLGDDINAKDANGDTAMHGAAYKHLPMVAQFLGDAGAKVEVWDQLNRDGVDPLRIATGIQRGMNFVFSLETAAVIRRLLEKAGAPAAAARP